MAFDYHRLKAAAFPPRKQAYTEDNAILYALGVGAGLAEVSVVGDETRFLYESRLTVLPSFVNVLAYPGFWMRDPEHGIDWARVMHGEQRMRFHAPLPPRATVCARMHVAAIADKGADKGACVVTRRTLTLADSDTPLATIEQVNICRGDGGYAKNRPELSDPLPSPIGPRPGRDPDRVILLPTSPNQAALYRLNADRNPLHIDPAAARHAGFDRPILHGAALIGMLDRALQHTLEDRSALRLGGLDVRFSSPVFPGTPVAVSLWYDDGGAMLSCSAGDDGRELARARAHWVPEMGR